MIDREPEDPDVREDTERTVRAYYAAFDDGDMDRFLGLLTEDVVHDVNQGPREVGRAAFAAFMECMNAHYRERIAELCVMTNADGARAAAEFLCTGEYLATDEGLPEARGQTYRLRAGAFFEVRDGKIARVSNHYDLADWIRQVSSG